MQELVDTGFVKAWYIFFARIRCMNTLYGTNDNVSHISRVDWRVRGTPSGFEGSEIEL